jgi:hypothetical protein
MRHSIRPSASLTRGSPILLRPRPPFLGEERPAFVIPPAPGDLEIAWREPLQSEAQPFDQCPGPVVAGLQVRLNSMQAHRAERVTKGEVDRLRHVALPNERSESVETDVSVVEPSSEDLAQVHDAGQGAVLAPAREEAAKVIAVAAIHVRCEGGFIGRW